MCGFDNLDEDEEETDDDHDHSDESPLLLQISRSHLLNKLAKRQSVIHQRPERNLAPAATK